MKNNYLVVTFEESSESKYRIVVFDKSGKEVFKTSDIAGMRNITIDNGKIYYLENSLKKICIANLK